MASTGWTVASASIQGSREANEDAYVATNHCGGVFDGVGGVAGGQAAAQAAASHLERAVADADPMAKLQEAVLRTGGATTATIMRWDSGDSWSIGDSSLLHVRADGVDQPFRADGVGHVLTQWLGKPEIKPQRIRLNVHAGDCVVLCTDGVHRLLDVADIARWARALPPEEAVAQILADVEQRGAPDNATVVVAKRN